MQPESQSKSMCNPAHRYFCSRVLAAYGAHHPASHFARNDVHAATYLDRCNSKPSVTAPRASPTSSEGRFARSTTYLTETTPDGGVKSSGSRGKLALTSKISDLHSGRNRMSSPVLRISSDHPSCTSFA